MNQTLGFVQNLAANLTTNAKHEHDAHCTSNGRSVKSEAQLWKNHGYQHVFCAGDESYFLENPQGHRIEIIMGESPRYPEHQAWAVPSQREYEGLFNNFYEDTDIFQKVDRLEVAGFCSALFRHKATNTIVEIVWRKEQIFENFF